MEILKHAKAALIDTCLIARAKDYSTNSKYLEKFFETLKSRNIPPLIHDLIKFEFFRGCRTQSHKQAKDDVLKLLAIESLPVQKEGIEQATIIANIYSNTGIQDTKISPIDCLNSALLKRYGDSLILVSLDINDYPLCIHDRFHIEVIDTKKEIINMGFFRFDYQAYQQKFKDFQSTK